MCRFHQFRQSGQLKSGFRPFIIWNCTTAPTWPIEFQSLRSPKSTTGPEWPTESWISATLSFKMHHWTKVEKANGGVKYWWTNIYHVCLWVICVASRCVSCSQHLVLVVSENAGTALVCTLCEEISPALPQKNTQINK